VIERAMERSVEAVGRGSRGEAAGVGPGSTLVIERGALDDLLQALRRSGYRLVGPTLRGGAIVHDEIDSARDLPEGWTDEQEPGSYRLKRRDDGAVFGFAVGPGSWKTFLHPPRVRLFRAARDGQRSFRLEAAEPEAARCAFIGVRACDLAAIAIQDRVLLEGPYRDPIYQARRESVFLLAVDCAEPGGTCFCASMGTGPRAASGFDLALTERLEDDRGEHTFLVRVGSPKGAAALAGLRWRPASEADGRDAEERAAAAAARMGRELDTSDVRGLLTRNGEHPRWDQVARRCLACANCTMVCPTCFCTTVEDLTDLDGRAERWRRWDSCFTLDFSYIHGGSVRRSARARYRQWLTHKLATWIDQFGTSGCVGCGRCITWCPVGIDITEEVRAIRGGDAPGAEGAPEKE
jgi:ferredoxin